MPNFEIVSSIATRRTAMRLEHITSTDLKSDSLLDDYFMIQGYMRDPMYTSDDYEWFKVYSIKDDTMPAGIICVKENKYVNGYLHVVALEVPQQIRKMGYGSAIVMTLKELAKKLNYKGLTLRMKEPSLYQFYAPLGFSEKDINGTNIMIWDTSE